VPTTVEPQERTFTSVGGTVRATCAGPSTARLISWSATRPFRVDRVDAGPAATAVATFKQGQRFVRMTVTCQEGVPSANTDED
jgi:serine/threonine-protein kinase